VADLLTYRAGTTLGFGPPCPTHGYIYDCTFSYEGPNNGSGEKAQGRRVPAALRLH